MLSALPAEELVFNFAGVRDISFAKTMRFLKKPYLVFAIALSLVTILARGSIFNYSYAFNDGRVVTGSFDGTRNGNLITDISNGTLYFDGIFVGDLSYIVPAFWTDPLMISIDGSQNNFVFDFDNGDPLGDTFAWFQSGDFGNVDPQFADVTFFGSNINEFGLSGFTQDNHDHYPVSGWTVVDTSTHSTPDVGATIVMLGMGVGGLVVLRRKFAGMVRGLK